MNIFSSAGDIIGNAWGRRTLFAAYITPRVAAVIIAVSIAPTMPRYVSHERSHAAKSLVSNR
jgi:predicted MFS family arabinose efflux permease